MSHYDQSRTIAKVINHEGCSRLDAIDLIVMVSDDMLSHGWLAKGRKHLMRKREILGCIGLNSNDQQGIKELATTVDRLHWKSP